MNFFIETLGCKVNIYESEMMAEKLLAAGYKCSKEEPDIYIINTCSVTNMADQKSRKLVRRIRRNHPNCILLVCGCSTQNKETDYQSMGIDILLGNNQKSEVVILIEKYKEKKQQYRSVNLNRNIAFEDMKVDKFQTHTRAFVKIQDGCDNFCTFCIIPHVRGSIRSKAFDLVVNEVKTLVQNGHQEVVLTGIHTGSYGTGLNYDLTDLIHEISKIERLKRIRISSIEITELDDKFLRELKENPKICNHLHIPLQTGTNEILKRMNRKYDLDYFEKKIKLIRSIRPNISISTDVIVGFPYETEALFQSTVKFCNKMKFSKMHVFPYSIREGTPAATMPNQNEETVKKDRSRLLNQISLELEQNYNEQFMNTEADVLIEEVYEGYSIGHTSNFLKVEIKAQLEKNRNYVVKITKVEKQHLLGETITVKS